MTEEQIINWINAKAVETGGGVFIEIAGDNEAIGGSIQVGPIKTELNPGEKPPATLAELLSTLITRAGD